MENENIKEIVVVVEDGMLTDVFVNNDKEKYVVNLIDLDIQDFDKLDERRSEVDQIRNSKKYKNIY